MTNRTSLCSCGHDAAAHEHFRRGSDCGACGRELCARFHADDTTRSVVVHLAQRLLHPNAA